MQARQLEGLWWTHGEPEARFPGTMVFSPEDGIYLRVFGGMRTGDHDQVLVHGLVQGAIPVTLHPGFRVSARFSRGEQVERYRFHFAWIGEHLEKPDDATFEEFHLDFTNLPEWVGRSSLTQKVGWESEPRSMSIEWSQPPQLILDLEFGKVEVRQGLKSNVDRHRMGSLEQTTELLVKPSPALCVREFLDAVGAPIQHLISLGTDRPIAYRSVSCSRSEEDGENDGRSSRHDRIEVLFHPILVPNDPPVPLHPHEVVFTLVELLERDGNAVEDWCQLWRTLAMPVRMFFSHWGSESSFAEQRFLGFVYGLEALHRTWDPSTELPEPEHERRIEEVLETSPVQHRAWLQKQLAHSNEPSFRSRLKSLIAEVEEPIANVVPSIRHFVHRTVLTRNYFVHRGERPSEVFEGAAVARAIMVLELLGKGFLLRQLGFAAGEIRDAWSHQRRYNWLEATVDSEQWN